MLRNQAEIGNKTLCLSNPSEVVRAVFEMVCFPKIFTITGAPSLVD